MRVCEWPGCECLLNGKHEARHCWGHYHAAVIAGLYCCCNRCKGKSGGDRHKRGPKTDRECERQPGKVIEACLSHRFDNLVKKRKIRRELNDFNTM